MDTPITAARAGEVAQTNAPTLPALPLSAPVDWDALRKPFARGWSFTYDRHSPFAYAWHIACALGAAQGPNGEKVEGWPLPIERDAIAIERGHLWFAKVERGETSCAWHEISEHYGTLAKCPCRKCEDARKAARACARVNG